MGGMDLGNEKQMSMNVATKVILHFSDLASAEKSVKSRHSFFPIVKRARVLVNLFSMMKPRSYGGHQEIRCYLQSGVDQFMLHHDLC